VAEELQRAGWKKARALIGGWNAIVAAGMPTQSKPIGIEHEHLE
jgi:3-mercaptopyruvate sulfurtransferase SseA